MKLYYKGVLCRLSTVRIMGEDKPALCYVHSPNRKTTLNAGFEEIQYGLWVKVLTDEEYDKISNYLDEADS